MRIFILALLTPVLMAQTSPPPNLIFVNIAGVPTVVTSDLTTGQLGSAPPPVLAKCMNGTTVVDCDFSGGGTNPGQQRIYSTYIANGDSITFGTGASDPSLDYVSLVADGVASPTVRNVGIIGAQACDISAPTNGNGPFDNTDNLNPPQDTNNALQSIMVGTNDANNVGAGPYVNVYKVLQSATLSFIATSNTRKFFGSSFGSVPTNWSLDTAYANNTGLQSTTNGASSVWPIQSYGNAIAIWYRIFATGAGSFTYSIDGGTPVSVNSFTTPAVNTGSEFAPSSCMGAVFIPGVVAGQHNVTITVTSPTDDGNIVGIMAVGSPTPASQFSGPPVVFAAGVPFQENDAKSADTAAYNQAMIDVTTSMKSMGFNVTFMNVRNYWFGTPSEMYDSLHPNDLGHSEIANGFLAAIQPIGLSLDSPLGTQVLSGGITGVTFTFPATITNLLVNGGAGTIALPTLPLGKVANIITYYGGNTGDVTITGVYGGNFTIPSVTSSPPSSSGASFVSLGNGNWLHLAKSF